MKSLSLLIFMVASVCHLFAQNNTKRTLVPTDVYKIKNIADPQVSPDGRWVAYVLSTVDTAKDKRNSDVWMVSMDGKENLQMTSTEDGESTPRWSPDGKYLSFLASRNADKQAQIWLMDRRGGEAKKLTDTKGDIGEYTWSPDGKKIALSILDQDFTDTSKTKTRLPYVMDRYQFKKDKDGWIENRFNHLYIFDIDTKKMDTLTKGNFNETSPQWSPNGKQLAFVSNRSADPDRNENDDIFIMNAEKSATAKKLTDWPGADRNPKWSPDGETIAYTSTTSNLNFTMYGQNGISLVTPATGASRSLAAAVDRNVSDIQWAADGKNIICLVADDRKQYVANVSIDNSSLSTIAGDERSFSNIQINPSGNTIATILSEPQMMDELYVIENKQLRRLTYVHDSVASQIQFSKGEGFTSTSKDGTKISGILYRPVNAAEGKKLPTIIFIHGGPVAQDDYGFDLSRQMLAAAGYAVAAVNYRGSNGRGIAFTKAIYADWGNKEVMDILGVADYLVKMGIADENKMGIGGWSYGGILTNYTIASTNRFKAAASGAGSSLQLSMYGVDQYISQYETELGAPWKNPKKWMDLSYPFFNADKISTPTLFMAGEKDFNVPSVGSEQMYQALRSLNVPTQLVIYPGQFHGISKPSYQVDRFERYIKWFDKYLK